MVKIDVLGHSIEVGRRYRVGPANHKTRTIVTIEDDFENGCLVAVDKQGNRMRVDELDDANVFELAESDPCEGHEKSLREQLYDIDERCKSARYQLDQLEIYACDLLGCQVGDGSDLADQVCRFVRDGIGGDVGIESLLEMVSNG